MHYYSAQPMHLCSGVDRDGGDIGHAHVPVFAVWCHSLLLRATLGGASEARLEAELGETAT